MINTEEVQSILAAIFCLNRIGERNMLIDQICDYAYRRLFGVDTHLLAFACLLQSKEETEQQMIELLKTTTEFKLYSENYE